MENRESKYVLMKFLIVYATTAKNNSDQMISLSMARMSDNEEFPSKNFGDSLKLTNWILYYVATCHMMPEVSDFISGLLDDADNILKLRTVITSWQNRKGNYE